MFSIFKGCGKSVIAREFAEILGYSIEPVMLYQVNENMSFKDSFFYNDWCHLHLHLFCYHAMKFVDMAMW